MHTRTKTKQDKTNNETCIALTGIALILKDSEDVTPDPRLVMQGLNKVGRRYNWGEIIYTQVKSGKLIKTAMFIPLVNNGTPIQFEDLSECDKYIEEKSQKARGIEDVAKAFSELPKQFRMHVESVQTGTTWIGYIPVGTQYSAEN